MNEKFYDWYVKVNLQPDNAILQARWKGIDAYINSKLTSPNEVFELIRLYNSKNVDEGFLDIFFSCFIDIDSAFSKKNVIELSVLAGATLVEIVNRNSKFANLVVLCMESYDFLENPCLVDDINTTISRLCFERRSHVREDLLTSTLVSSSAPSVKNVLATLKTENAVWGEDIRKTLVSYFSTLGEYVKNIGESSVQASKKMEVLKEDSDILWWMVGEWSNDLNKPFSKVDLSTTSIISGKELADFISVLPGPLSADAVLYKILLLPATNSGGKDKFNKFIDDLPVEWKSNFIEKYSSITTKEITPIITCIMKSQEVSNPTEWVSIINKSFNKNPSTLTSDPLKVAKQVYVECLIVKSIQNLGGE